MFLVLQDPCVVLFNKIFLPFHLTLANLYCVWIEYLSTAMISKEMFTNELEQLLAYVCLNI